MKAQGFKTRIFNESAWTCFFKKHLSCHPSLKIFKFEEGFLTLAFFQMRINFVPIGKTLGVAKLGCNLFERLCYPTGITWFQKYVMNQNPYISSELTILFCIASYKKNHLFKGREHAL